MAVLVIDGGPQPHEGHNLDAHCSHACTAVKFNYACDAVDCAVLGKDTMTVIC